MLLTVILSIGSLLVGVQNLDLQGLLALEETPVRILTLSRIPRLLSILFAGIAMSISGLIMQQLTRNRFVSPTTATTIDSAKMGFLFGLLLFPGSSLILRMVLSFLFALGGTFLFMKILRSLGTQNPIIIPLVGIMMGNVIDSVTSFFAIRFDLLQNIGSWMQGNFAMITRGRYELLFLSLPFLVLAALYANKFTIAGMGDDFAANLGLKAETIQRIGISIVAILTSLVVINVGQIPYLGLIVPNIVTMYRGDHLKNNLLTTGLLGANFLLLTDLLGRLVIHPYEIPIGLMIGVLGSVVFLVLIVRRRHPA
jgi:iron complex transport system permease protein